MQHVFIRLVFTARNFFSKGRGQEELSSRVRAAQSESMQVGGFAWDSMSHIAVGLAVAMALQLQLTPGILTLYFGLSFTDACLHSRHGTNNHVRAEP